MFPQTWPPVHCYRHQCRCSWWCIPVNSRWWRNLAYIHLRSGVSYDPPTPWRCLWMTGWRHSQRETHPSARWQTWMIRHIINVSSSSNPQNSWFETEVHQTRLLISMYASTFMGSWPVCRELRRKGFRQKTWFPHVVDESWSILQLQSKRKVLIMGFLEINNLINQSI